MLPRKQVDWGRLDNRWENNYIILYKELVVKHVLPEKMCVERKDVVNHRQFGNTTSDYILYCLVLLPIWWTTSL